METKPCVYEKVTKEYEHVFEGMFEDKDISFACE
jgi:hypothetical protein